MGCASSSAGAAENIRLRAENDRLSAENEQLRAEMLAGSDHDKSAVEPLPEKSATAREFSSEFQTPAAAPEDAMPRADERLVRQAVEAKVYAFLESRIFVPSDPERKRLNFLT